MPLTRKLASKSLIKQNTNQDVFGTGVTNLVRDAFIGTGSQKVFNLTISPLSAVNTQVFISGVYQNKDTYYVSGNVLTFNTAPLNLAIIEVISGTNYSIGIPGDGTVSNVKLSQSPAYTIKSNNTASPATPTDITVPQLAAMFTAPTIQRLTTVGSGTYTTPPNVKYLRIKMVGGGGGGSSAGNLTRAGTGGTTTFGSSLLTANGGEGGICASNSNPRSPGLGGTVSVNSPAISIVALKGGDTPVGSTSSATEMTGGAGAASPFGGAGGSMYTQSGTPATPNSGSGGGGNGGGSGIGGSGGAAGGYVEALIVNPSPTYSYTIGAGGIATGSAGTGGSGVIIVEEYYQ